MRYKKIFLINPPYSGNRIKVVFCAGLGYIAEVLETSGFKYDVLDLSLGYTDKVLKKRIEDFKPDLIGISMMTYRYKETYNLIRNIKKDYPQIDIVAGGPHISLFREKVLNDCSSIDYGVVLEGERTIVELCKGNPLDSIKGLILKRKDTVVYNGDRPLIKDLDAISFPRYERFELDKSFRKEINALPIVSSRGCPFECIYCPVKSSIGETFRARSPESIIDEISYWYRKGYRRFSFADDNFTLLKDRVYRLCEEIKKSNLKDLILSCDNGIRADKVDRDLLKFMHAVGFRRIALGVEAGNNRILKKLKKRVDVETIKRIILDACNLGLEVDLFFLVGSPDEGWQDLEDSFKIALDYPISIAYFYNLIPFPGTELFSWIEKNGKFLKNPDDYLNDFPILDNFPVFETPGMSFKQRKKALSCAFSIMRKTMRRAWARRMKKYGLLGKIFAIIYATGLVQDKLLRNRKFKSFLYRTMRYFLND